MNNQSDANEHQSVSDATAGHAHGERPTEELTPESASYVTQEVIRHYIEVADLGDITNVLDPDAIGFFLTDLMIFASERNWCYGAIHTLASWQHIEIQRRAHMEAIMEQRRNAVQEQLRESMINEALNGVTRSA